MNIKLFFKALECIWKYIASWCQHLTFKLRQSWSLMPRFFAQSLAKYGIYMEKKSLTQNYFQKKLSREQIILVLWRSLSYILFYLSSWSTYIWFWSNSKIKTNKSKHIKLKNNVINKQKLTPLQIIMLAIWMTNSFYSNVTKSI